MTTISNSSEVRYSMYSYCLDVAYYMLHGYLERILSNPLTGSLRTGLVNDCEISTLYI